MCANVAISGIRGGRGVGGRAAVSPKHGDDEAGTRRRFYNAPCAPLLAAVGETPRHPAQHRREPIETSALEGERGCLPIPAQRCDGGKKELGV